MCVDMCDTTHSYVGAHDARRQVPQALCACDHYVAGCVAVYVAVCVAVCVAVGVAVGALCAPRCCEPSVHAIIMLQGVLQCMMQCMLQCVLQCVLQWVCCASPRDASPVYMRVNMCHMTHSFADNYSARH